MTGYLFAAACAVLLCACYGAGRAAPQHDAVTRLATAIRASVTELHEILGVVRGEHPAGRGMSAVGGLINEFRAAGAAVSLRSCGTPRRLPPRADEAAYRVVEEGLTNAIRHAPGQPASVLVTWEDRRLLLMVSNAADRGAYTPGSGLADLAGRLRHAGGSLTHDLSGGRFRLQAIVPATPVPGTMKRSGASVLGLAAGILLLVILPATILLGVH
jgi:signal transduction histidine kinase